ncbi:hypothetical protein BDQ12DRAFT_676485 [Crucibulum laeve]|uniref:Uncharacterized protein n=1 Tax=Crucibulum laeve TaxID=68775 RepID=A0A5C3MCG9_9AGAR|nr:hypothetical protein BDQ12DRAFT_676485 [Crucibulum laeve]
MSAISEKRLATLGSHLQRYTLPEMEQYTNVYPIPGHKSHKNYLNVRPEDWRQDFYDMEIVKWDLVVNAWLNDHLSPVPLDLHLEVDEKTSLSHLLSEELPTHLSKRPTDMDSLVPWVADLPLAIVQDVLHLAFPETREWSFQWNDTSEPDSHIFQHFTWTPSESYDPALAQTRSVVVAVQPPWILSDMDFKQFARCKTFPPCRASGTAFSTPLQSHHRVWAKLWDTCAIQDSHWFILTSYRHWVFGAFSMGRTHAYLSEVYDFEHSNPTVIQCIAFWICSAMQMTGCWIAPKKGLLEPVSALKRPKVTQVNEAFPTPARSESDWTDRSTAPGSSAGIWTGLEPDVSDMGSEHGFATPRNRTPEPGIPSQFLEGWLKNTVSTGIAGRPENDAMKMTLLADIDAIGRDAYQGEWLMG